MVDAAGATELDDPEAVTPPRRQRTVHRPWVLGATSRWHRSRAQVSRALERLNVVASVSFAGALVFGGVVPAVQPATGITLGWETAINITSHRDWQYGPQVLFTYGPWGFLDTPLALYRTEYALGLMFSLFVVMLLWAATYVCMRRVASTAAAAAVAFVLPVALPQPVTAGIRIVAGTAVVAILCIERCHRSERTRLAIGLAAIIGATAGLLLQVKFPEGVALLAIVGAMSLTAVPRRRTGYVLGAAVLSFAVSFMVFWVIAGQHIGNIGTWVKGSIALSTGYSEAMAYERPPFILGYAVAVGGLVFAVIRAFRNSADLTRRRALGVAAVVVIALYFGFKEGFTRHDAYGGHDSEYFAIAALVLIALARERGRAIAPLMLAGLMLTFAGASLENFNPYAVRDSWRGAAQSLLDSHYHADRVTAAATAARSTYALSPRLLGQIGPNPVSIDPWEVTLASAYHLKWRPVPIFQAYSAYTPSLDSRNARAIVQAPADQRVLREMRAIDGRNPLWETPRYLLSLACNYSEVGHGGRWQLLRHTTNRCGTARTIYSSRVSPGNVIEPPVAPAGDIVVAHYYPADDGLIRSAGDLLFKPTSHVMVSANGVEFVVPRALCTGPLLVQIPHQLEWPRHFGGGLQYGVLSFNRPGRVVFEAIPVV